MGNIYEISARLEIAKIFGFHYSSKFEISDLNGLVRLALLRKIHPSGNPDYDQTYIQAHRADKIAKFIYKNNLLAKLKNSISFIRSLSKDTNYNKNLHDLANRAEKALTGRQPDEY